MSSDNPLQNATLARLDKTEEPGPYEYIGRNGKTKITFPDPGEMDWLEAEEFLADITTEKDSHVLKKWLSDEDYQKALGEKWTLREKNRVLRDVLGHYEDIFGTQGEGTASES